MTRRTKLRITLLLVLALVVAGGTVWLFGPREPVDADIHFDAGAIGRDPQSYLAAREAQVPGVLPETTKEIVWAYPASRARTPLVIVYVHGFSGDRRELAPVPQQVAAQLGANLFLTRLTGHGRGLAALAEPSANDWLNDLAEALSIARQLGDRVVVMGTSNGGALTTWGASLPGFMDDVAGLILVSPSYRLADWRSPLLTIPYARQITAFVTGGGFDMPLADPVPGGAQTATLPSASLLPLAALAAHVRDLDFSAIHLPALFIYSPSDRIVDPLETESVIQRWGGPSEVLLVQDSGDPVDHMLAGDMFSPSTTGRVVEAMVDFIRRLD